MGAIIIAIGLIYAVSPRGLNEMKCAKHPSLCDVRHQTKGEVQNVQITEEITKTD
jgi:hypothetical protein